MKLLRYPLYALLAFSLSACHQEETLEMVGTLERDRIEIKVESNEPIISRHVLDGQAVHAGDLLVLQDPERAQARLELQIAQRQQAAARLAELRRGPRQEVIGETRARLAAAQALTENAKSDLTRTQEIFAKGLSSQAALDSAESRWKSSKAEQAAILKMLDAQLEGTTLEELEQAEAALAAADALLNLAELDLERTRLVAPADGIIDKMLYQVGERPPVGMTIAVLLDASRVYARIYVPENLRAQVRPGKVLQVSVDGVAEVLSGTVSWVSSDASFTPYFALTEHDRSRLSYLAEVDVAGAQQLPSGVPLVVTVPHSND